MSYNRISYLLGMWKFVLEKLSFARGKSPELMYLDVIKEAQVLILICTERDFDHFKKLNALLQWDVVVMTFV
ncbi:hypothetical protein Tco_1282181 [Tanacetum coccineum]